VVNRQILYHAEPAGSIIAAWEANADHLRFRWQAVARMIA
jgi:hypothetical protein